LANDVKRAEKILGEAFEVGYAGRFRYQLLAAKADLLKTLERYVDAKNAYLDAVVVYSETPDGDPEWYLELLIGTADNYLLLGEPANAVRCAENARRLAAAGFGEESLRYVMSQYLWAVGKLKLDEPVDAVFACEQLVGIAERLGAEVWAGLGYHLLAEAYQAQGLEEKARSALRRAPAFSPEAVRRQTLLRIVE
jgi:tetratricopeptide (TPR) repeat protein